MSETICRRNAGPQVFIDDSGVMVIRTPDAFDNKNIWRKMAYSFLFGDHTLESYSFLRNYTFESSERKANTAYKSFISKQADKLLAGNAIKCSAGLMLEIKKAAINNSFEI